MKKWILALVTIVFILLLIPNAYCFEIDEVSTVTSVIDGDSFYIEGDEVRLADVSCPEWDESGGSEATTALASLIEGSKVYLDTDQKTGRGPYGRLIAVVYIDFNTTHRLNVNEFMLQAGFATLTDYSNNEFNPSTWRLLEPTFVNEEIIEMNEKEVLTKLREEAIDEYILLHVQHETLNEEHEQLQSQHEALQEEYYQLESQYLDLETQYNELNDEKKDKNSIPGFDLWIIWLGLIVVYIKYSWK